MKPVSLKSLPEAQLGRYQSQQAGNNCTLHAISAAVEILCGQRLEPSKLIEEVNRLWWRGRFYRVLPNNAVTPRMQARIVNYLARQHRLPLHARSLHTSPEILRNLPYDENVAALVTLYWLPRQAPGIYQGRTGKNYNAVRGMGAHTMLFAAYNPQHNNEDELQTPWGFINSWSQSSESLFWMEDQAFRKSWGFRLPRLGYNATVLISNTTLETYTL